MLVSIDIKIENSNFTADTDCDFYYSFLSNLFILCLSAYQRYGPLIVKLPKQYKSKEGVKISTIVFIQTIVLVSELTP